MMNNLFSTFDPATSTHLSLNWLAFCLIPLFLPLNFWGTSSQLNLGLTKTMSFLFQDWKFLATSPSILLISFSLFLMLSTLNLTGLFPFIFTTTAHLAVSFPLAFLMWISFLLMGWSYKSKIMLAHLLPTGTPPPLMNFMVLIESISQLIRPLTLAIRLSANMLAGHLLLTLLGNASPNSLSPNSLLIYFSQMILIILEMAVALIQSYVFISLINLYFNEIL